MATPPVLIAGAGPTGLYLALLLARSGLSVRILEKDLHPQHGARGLGIQPRSLEIMHMLGVLPQLQRHGMVPRNVCIYKLPEGIEVLNKINFFENVEPTPNAPVVESMGVAQDVHTKIIRDALTQYGVHVEFGKSLRQFTQDADGVSCDILTIAEDGTESQEQLRASFLCGADGARGSVRKLLGCTFLGETKEADAIIVADLEVKGNLARETAHMWSNKQPGGVTNMLIHMNPHSDQMCLVMAGTGFDLSAIDIHAPGTIQRLFKEHVTRDDIVLAQPNWLSHFRPSVRMVDKFGDGRVFVLGDAAHTHPPTGGQGMNSGVQDALNLYWKLALVSKNLAPISLLSTFTEERLPVIAQMLNKTAMLYTQARDPNRDASRDVRGRELFMLGVNYRWSPLVLDTRTPRGASQEALDTLRAHAYGGHSDEAGEPKVVAGDRAPDATALLDAKTSRPMRLFDIFDLKRHTVLLFASPTSVSAAVSALETLRSLPAVPAEVQTLVLSRQPLGVVDLAADLVLTDSEGHAFGGYDAKGDELTIVVVRPDTYIGAVVTNPAEMAQYFAQVFSGSS